MFHAVGNRVTMLHREAIGPLVLDPVLRPGEFRLLTVQEVEALRIPAGREESAAR
jgi:16S rRNA pseudouridine516 synthase